MAISNNSSLFPVLRFFIGLLIGKENLNLYDTVDWEKSSEFFETNDFVYPDYYISQDFHGIRGGYLNAIAPITYDAIRVNEKRCGS
ncbi:MAG: hypothetical protein WBM44_05740 [Waterburya sp.]